MPKVLRHSSLAVLALAIAGCHNANNDLQIEPFNPRAMQAQERQAAADAPSAQVMAMPTTMQSPFEPARGADNAPPAPPATGRAIGVQEGIVHLSLQDILHRCAEHNATVQVAGYDPAIDETRVTEAQAAFDPTFYSNFQYSLDRELAPTPQNPDLSTNSELDFRSYDTQVGIKQQLDSGGKIDLRYEPRRTRRDPGFGTPNTPNPFWTSDLTLEITQPLLQNFGTDVNRARIFINKHNQRISLQDFRQALEKNLNETEQTYWQLYEAEREVKIAEELLNRTLGTGQVLYNRLTQDVGRVQMSEANSSIEQRRTALIQARAAVRDLSDQLKNQMNDPEFPVTGNVLILPSEAPIMDQIRLNEQDEIATAMENRSELGQQQLRSENAEIAANVAKNNLLPQLNFVGSVGAEGLGGEYIDSLRDQYGLDHFQWSAGLQLEIPIGNRAARAIWKRAQLQRLQADAQYRALVDQVALDVRKAVREVNTEWEKMVGTKKSRIAAADALSAVEERERASEALTPEFVNRKLGLQQQLADAETNEVDAVAKYQVALSNLEKAKGTLLRYNNVIMEESPSRSTGAIP